ncbi:MAG TPA: cupin domain-containing protein [Solirubrobacterales bacterium]|nr:cupin domain-containing protein [Solirubrobacterales bacterium]
MNSSEAPAEALRVGGDLIEPQMTSVASGGALFAYDVTFAPGGGPPHLHRHDAVELFKLEHGELTFYLADEHGELARRSAGPGEVVAVPANREHTVRNESRAPARALAVLSPGEEMERFARLAAALGAAANPERVAALAAETGIEITRPLPPPVRPPLPSSG